MAVSFGVEKSVVIEKPAEEIMSAIVDFAEWAKWSPWLSLEPGCDVRLSGIAGHRGHKQRWEGKYIGSGEVELMGVVEGKSADYEITFFKPWKSKSRFGFRLKDSDSGTRVTWWMQGTLPFFLFFMKRMMSAWIGSDYNRGLLMLKDYLEEGSVPSSLSMGGVVERPVQYYFGKRRGCTMEEVGPLMEQDLMELGALLEAGTVPQPVQVMSLYHRFDMAEGRCDYTVGFFYNEPVEPAAGYVSGKLPAHRALSVEHVGAYRHLGNAWAAAMGCARAGHKQSRAVPMYEIYLNNPKEVPENEAKVQVLVPVVK